MCCEVGWQVEWWLSVRLSLRRKGRRCAKVGWDRVLQSRLAIGKAVGDAEPGTLEDKVFYNRRRTVQL